MTQNLQRAALEPATVKVEISLERAEQLARLGLIPNTFSRHFEGTRIVDVLSLEQYNTFLKKYLSACALKNSANTVEQKRKAFEKFTAYVHTSGTDRVGEDEVRGFIEYVKEGYLSAKGRWGNRHLDARYSELALPLVECGRAYIVFAAQVGNRQACLILLEQTDDLLLAESTFHKRISFNRNSRSFWNTFGGQGQTGWNSTSGAAADILQLQARGTSGVKFPSGE